MRKIAILASALTLLLGAGALAADNDSHDVTITVDSINELEVLGGNITLTIDAASPGSEPTADTDATCDLEWTTNDTGRKITVVSDAAIADVTLTVEALNVTGGTTAGEKTVSDAAADFVTAVSETVGACDLSYEASATASQGTSSDTYTITYTIVAA